MSPERMQQVEELFHATLEREPSQRAAFLSEACDSDPELLAEVESLISAQEREGSFIERPAIEEAGDWLLDIPAKPTSDRVDDVPKPAGVSPVSRQSTLPIEPPKRMARLLKGRYLIERELGRGGIGIVYLARDQQLHGKPVVVKVLLDDTCEDAWFKKKFRQEIEALSRIDHPGIVGILDAGETPDGKPFLVMQFIRGVDLRSLIRVEGMAFAEVASIIQQAGLALTAAHDNGVIHCDLKPENIMLQDLGEGRLQVKLVDFGIAKIKDSQVKAGSDHTRVAGTTRYMAPEQIEGKPSAASDVFALGVIAYELVTGRCPFNPISQYTVLDTLRAGVKVKPMDLRPDLPDAAQEMILKALSFYQRDRYERACDFSEGLARALTAEASNQTQPSPRESLIGRTLGQYKVLSEISHGATGEVYLAQNTMLGRNAALKLLPAEHTNDKDKLRRFKHEALAANNLNHPNILTIYDIGEVESRYFVATEYVEGETLRWRISREKMKLRDAVDVAIQVSAALEAGHRAGLVHRHIEPESIRLRSDGVVKVMDFGIANLVENHRVSGDSEATTAQWVESSKNLPSPKYMSPEQLRGLDLDGRTDIFSLGVVMYQMITGQAAFEGATAADVAESILKDEPSPLSSYTADAPAELQQIASKALCKDREERYQAVKDLTSDLKTLSEELKRERQAQRVFTGGTTVKTIDAKDSALDFAAIAIDPKNEYWAGGRTLRFTSPYPHEYPFGIDCKYEFHLAEKVIGADPTFDITIINTDRRPVLVTSIGVEIVSVGFLAPVIKGLVAGALPRAVKVEKHDSHTIMVPDIWSLLAVNEKWVHWNEKWSSALGSLNDHPEKGLPGLSKTISIDLNHIVSIRPPEPLYLQREAPYRYGLVLKGYVTMPAHVVLRMWILTNSGESRSEEIYLKSFAQSETICLELISEFVDRRSIPEEAGGESTSEEIYKQESGARRPEIKPNYGTKWGQVAAGLVLAVGILVASLFTMSRATLPREPAERSLTYSLEVQKYRDGKPFQEPFRHAGEMNFEKAYRVRLNVSSPQPGYLYVINEGPNSTDETPDLNVLFPSPTANGGSGLLAENQHIQIPDQSWLQFDGQAGSEKVWLVWSAQTVAELEAVRGFANPKDRGGTSNPAVNSTVKEFLKAHSLVGPAVEKDDERKETTIKAGDGILVYAVNLDHH